MNLVHDYRFLSRWLWKFVNFVKGRKMWNKFCGGTSKSSTMATFSVPLKIFMLDICCSIKKFNEDTTTIKELIFSSPLLLKKHTHSVTNVWRQQVAERSSIFSSQHTNGIFTINNNNLQRLILAFFSLEVRSPFWTEFSNAKWNKFIETSAAIFVRLLGRIIFIFTRVSRECQGRQKQGDVVIFRAFFVFTRPIRHAQFVNCRASRACALKNRKPQKWHRLFDYRRVLGISIRLTLNAHGLWGRDWAWHGDVNSLRSKDGQKQLAQTSSRDVWVSVPECQRSRVSISDSYQGEDSYRSIWDIINRYRLTKPTEGLGMTSRRWY